jgi:hypothetical protein
VVLSYLGADPAAAAARRSCVLRAVTVTAMFLLIPAITLVPTMWLGAGGHGFVCCAVFLFPWAILSGSIVGGIAQWCVYAAIAGTTAYRNRGSAGIAAILLVHILACVIGALCSSG